jgi:CBS domain-containing protein/ribosome-associated translation inhibitor RaiA
MADKTAKDIMTKEVVTIGADLPLMDAILKMDQYGIQEVPVVDGKKQLIGMVTYYDILDYIKADPNEKVSKVMVMPPTIALNTPIEEVARQMIASGVEALPVLEDKKVVGIVSEYDIAKVIVTDQKLKGLKIKDVMRPAENVLKKDEFLSAARRMMRYQGLDRIPVVDDDGKSLGLIVSTDILQRLIMPKQRRGKMDLSGEQTSLLSLPVSALMRTNMPIIRPEDELTTSIEKMIKANIKGVQVVDENEKVVGIVQRWDLLDRIIERRIQEGIWLNFSGLKLPLDTVEVLRNYMLSDIKRIKRIAPDTKSIDFHIKKLHGATEDKWNYQINASLVKNNGNKEAVYEMDGYNLMFTLSDAVNKLSEQLEKAADKKTDRNRTSGKEK